MTNTYAGVTNVNAGVLQLQNGAAILDTAGAVNVANLATLQLLNSETISSYVGADDGANENDSLLAIAGFTLTTNGNATIANVTTAKAAALSPRPVVRSSSAMPITTSTARASSCRLLAASVQRQIHWKRQSLTWKEIVGRATSLQTPAT